jgi:hypothetical protein
VLSSTVPVLPAERPVERVRGRGGAVLHDALHQVGEHVRGIGADRVAGLRTAFFEQ